MPNKDITPRILALQKNFYNQYKQNKDSWVKKYGSEAEQVMTGASFKRAKSSAEKADKLKIKEAVKKALMGPVNGEEIDSKAFIQSREENPIDSVSLDIPLLIRIMEYAREDAKDDMDLHFVAENIIMLSKSGKTLTMKDYNNIISK